jgi:hypothetical protein
VTDPTIDSLFYCRGSTMQKQPTITITTMIIKLVISPWISVPPKGTPPILYCQKFCPCYFSNPTAESTEVTDVKSFLAK